MKPSLTVLHIGKYFPPGVGGMEVFLKEVCIGLTDSGITNVVLAHDHEFGKSANREEHIHADNGGEIRIFRAKTYGQLSFVPISPSFPLLLHKLIKKEDPDIIHIHLPNLSAIWLLFLTVTKKRPWVVHWHSDVIASKYDWKLRMFNPLYKLFEHALLKRANKIIATSSNYLNESEALSKWQCKCEVIPLGINPKNISSPCDAQSTTTPYWPNHHLRVLSIGRLTYYKGFEILIHAVRSLTNVSVIIAGDGTMRQKLQHLIDIHGMNDRVFLAGHITESEKSFLLAHCECFCLPSYEKTEAFGMVLLEAMAFKKPLIACNIQGSGVSSVVRHKMNGLLVKPESVSSLSDALNSASRPEFNFQQLGNSGHQDLHKNFHIKHIVMQLDALYNNLIMSYYTQSQ